MTGLLSGNSLEPDRLPLCNRKVPSLHRAAKSQRARNPARVSHSALWSLRTLRDPIDQHTRMWDLSIIRCNLSWSMVPQSPELLVEALVGGERRALRGASSDRGDRRGVLEVEEMQMVLP